MIYILSAPLRQLFKDAGYIPKTVIYIEAKTQSGKTTFAQGLGCPFVSSNESYPNYTRVSSTQAFVEDAMSFSKIFCISMTMCTAIAINVFAELLKNESKEYLGTLLTMLHVIKKVLPIKSIHSYC